MNSNTGFAGDLGSIWWGNLRKSGADVVKTEILQTGTFYMSDWRAGERIDVEAGASELTRRSSGTVGVEFLD